MVELLVIPDGAAERPGPQLTSLERARTPALDALCAHGAVTLAATTPPGLPPGSETGIPTLLGARLVAAPSRALIEAAAAGIELPPGASAWRCDLRHRGRRFVPARPEQLAAALEVPCLGRYRAFHLRGHRFLLIGAGGRPAPRLAGLDVRVWGDGAGLPRVLDATTVIVCGPGACAGAGRLLGAEVRIPAGATGGPDTDLVAKRETALAALEEGRQVVVHVGWPDEAAHEGDSAGKVKALEAIDELLLAPLAEAVLAAGGRLAVCPDHGTDPVSGEHSADPVPAVRAGAGVVPAGPERLIERALAGRAAA